MHRNLKDDVLQVRSASVHYGAHQVLQDISFTLKKGEFLGIVGPNGGGKTTLLRALLGLITPSSGEVLLFGEHATTARARRRLSYVPQHVVHVDPRFPATVHETAMLGRIGKRGLMRRFNGEDRRLVDEALDEVDVAHLADDQIGTLSGGQRQRVFLAKALAAQPELLILDEPTTGVDPKTRESFYRLLDHLNHEHELTVLLVSHDTHALVLTAHRLLALNHRIVYDGPPKDFHEAGGTSGAYEIDVPHTAGGHG